MNCRAIIVIAILALTATAASASAQDDALGLYFSDSEFTLDTAHTVTTPGFTTAAYIVLTNPTGTMVTGYEVDITSTAADFAIPLTNLAFDATNLGTNTNQIVTFFGPKPTSPAGTVLTTVFIATDSVAYEEIAFGPADPSSLPDDAPVVDYGAGGLVACSAPFAAPAVAWLNGTPVPARQMSWGSVRALFR